ncbi:MAG: hypothetical protein H0W67_03480 [Gemmatimonadales bacterium]|nr:hypothetical protein [Gemmatimonadales bacterium]
MLLRLLVLSALSVGAGAAPPDTGAPTTVRYRVDQTLSQEVDPSAMGGTRQTLTFTTSSFVTVTIADSAGGRSVHVVMDSVKGDSATPIPKPVLDSAKGSAFHGFLDGQGKLDGLEPVSESGAGARVQGLLADFFPWVRAGLKAGQRWSDTTARKTGQGTDSVTVRRVTRYATAPGRHPKARQAVQVTSDFTSSVGGTQTTPSGPAKIEGTGTGSGTYYVTPDGRYLGGDWRQRSELKVTGSFAPKPLPITVAQTIKVTVLT